MSKVIKIKESNEQKIHRLMDQLLNELAFRILSDLVSYSQAMIIEIEEKPLSLTGWKDFRESKEGVEDYLVTLINENFLENIRLSMGLSEENFKDALEEELKKRSE